MMESHVHLRWNEFRHDGHRVGAMVIGPSGAGLFYDDGLELVEYGFIRTEDLEFVDRERLIGEFTD